LQQQQLLVGRRGFLFPSGRKRCGPGEKLRVFSLQAGMVKKACPCIDMFSFERQALSLPGVQVVAGVDEVGRGPLAGPVVVAAVILPLEQDFGLPVQDSKALSPAWREELAQALREDPRVRYAFALRSASEIDRLNILQATHECMRESVGSLQPVPDFALIDGLPVHDFPIPARFIVKGDGVSASIAAASILAKSHRDALMLEFERQYPGYGFARHKGYGTAEHLAALRRLGPCPEHRLSFAPLRELLEPSPEQLSLPW
jgi:ribonuclease HII